MDDPRRFVDPNVHDDNRSQVTKRYVDLIVSTVPPAKLVEVAEEAGLVPKLEPIGDMVEKGLSDILVDSHSLDCTDRPSCQCPKCQARLRKMLKDSARRIESGHSPFNRAQRRALKHRRKPR